MVTSKQSDSLPRTSIVVRFPKLWLVFLVVFFAVLLAEYVVRYAVPWVADVLSPAVLNAV